MINIISKELKELLLKLYFEFDSNSQNWKLSSNPYYSFYQYINPNTAHSSLSEFTIRYLNDEHSLARIGILFDQNEYTFKLDVEKGHSLNVEENIAIVGATGHISSQFIRTLCREENIHILAYTSSELSSNHARRIGLLTPEIMSKISYVKYSRDSLEWIPKLVSQSNTIFYLSGISANRNLESFDYHFNNAVLPYLISINLDKESKFFYASSMATYNFLFTNQPRKENGEIDVNESIQMWMSEAIEMLKGLNLEAIDYQYFHKELHYHLSNSKEYSENSYALSKLLAEKLLTDTNSKTYVIRFEDTYGEGTRFNEESLECASNKSIERYVAATSDSYVSMTTRKKLLEQIANKIDSTDAPQEKYRTYTHVDDIVHLFISVLRATNSTNRTPPLYINFSPSSLLISESRILHYVLLISDDFTKEYLANKLDRDWNDILYQLSIKKVPEANSRRAHNPESDLYLNSILGNDWEENLIKAPDGLAKYKDWISEPLVLRWNSIPLTTEEAKSILNSFLRNITDPTSKATEQYWNELNHLIQIMIESRNLLVPLIDDRLKNGSEHLNVLGWLSETITHQNSFLIQLSHHVFQNSKLLRALILDHVKMESEIVFNGKGFICVLLNTKCPLGCAHCMFNSIADQDHNPDLKLSAPEIEKLLKLVKESNTGYFLVSSAGESFLDMETIYTIGRESAALVTWLVTSGVWANSKSKCDSIIKKLVVSVEEGQRFYSNRYIFLRISIDEEHLHRMERPGKHSLEFFKNIVDSFERFVPHDSQLKLMVHGIKGEELIVEDIATYLNAEIISNDDLKNLHQELKVTESFATIRTTGGVEFDITFAKLLYSDLSADLKDKSLLDKRIEVFDQDTYVNEKGSPAIMFNEDGSIGPDMFVSFDGHIAGGWQSEMPDVKIDLLTDDYKSISSKTLSDPGVAATIEKGMEYRFNVIQEISPKSVIQAKAINLRDYTSRILFDEERVRLYYSIRAIQDYKVEGRFTTEQVAKWPSILKHLIHLQPEQLIEVYKDAKYDIIKQFIREDGKSFKAIIDVLSATECEPSMTQLQEQIDIQEPEMNEKLIKWSTLFKRISNGWYELDSLPELTLEKSERISRILSEIANTRFRFRKNSTLLESKEYFKKMVNNG